MQQVLAARQDLEEARDNGDAESVDRVEHALRESSQLLRSTMTQLHPAVLERSGLAQAVRDRGWIHCEIGKVSARSPGRNLSDPGGA